MAAKKPMKGATKTVQTAVDEGASSSWNNFQSHVAELLPFSTTPGARSTLYSIFQFTAKNEGTIAGAVEAGTAEVTKQLAEANGLNDPDEGGPSLLNPMANPEEAHLPGVEVPKSLSGGGSEHSAHPGK